MGLVCVLTHAPMHSCTPIARMHASAPRQVPITHAGVAPPQRFPSIPQFAGSLCRSTQLPPAVIVRPVRQVHAPITHACVSAQRRPIIPQLLKSVWMFTHVVPESIVPAGHWHWPIEQPTAPVQRRPHAPQLFTSLTMSAQPPFMQRTVLGPHVHAPIAHEPPGPHERPHIPQLLTSVASVAQVVPHAAVPIGQAHMPIVHVAPIGHARPQRPQFALSD